MLNNDWDISDALGILDGSARDALMGGQASGLPIVSARDFFTKGALTPRAPIAKPAAQAPQRAVSSSSIIERKEQLIALMEGGMSLREASRTTEIPYTTAHATWARRKAQRKAECSDCGVSLVGADDWHLTRRICKGCHGARVAGGQKQASDPGLLLERVREIADAVQATSLNGTRIEQACTAVGRIQMSDLEQLPAGWRVKFARTALELLSIIASARRCVDGDVE